MIVAFVIPPLDKLVIVSCRTRVLDVEIQAVLLGDFRQWLVQHFLQQVTNDLAEFMAGRECHSIIP